MEGTLIRKVDTPSLIRRAGLVLMVLLLATLVGRSTARSVLAQGSCPPPAGNICLGDGGGGTNPPPVVPPGEPGDPGGGGDPGGPPPPPPGDPGEPGDPGGGSDPIEPDEPVGQYYQNYYCRVIPECDEYANVVAFCHKSSHNSPTECWLVDYTCAPAAMCEATPPTPGDPGRPCTPSVGGGGVAFDCPGDEGNGFDWGYQIGVHARVPPHGVQSAPFPRWMVGQVGTLQLLRDPLYSVEGGPNGPGGEGGFWSGAAHIPNPPRADPAEGDIRNYQLAARWRMVFPGQSYFGGPSVPHSCWDFDDGTGLCGDIAAHAYERSSWGKPENGPSFHPEEDGCDKVGPWNLPAYQVRVPTYWLAEWNSKWETYTRTGTEWGSCSCYSSKPGGDTQGCSAPPGICIKSGEWYGKTGEPKYKWVGHEAGWHPLDMREFGYADWWYESWGVRAQGEGGSWCPNHTFTGGPGDAAPVPVIEVQSIIVDPCRLEGTCGDLNP